MSEKLKILCLHGYGHNGKDFLNSIGDLTRIVKDRVEFVPLDGPQLFSGPCDEGRCWWTLKNHMRGTEEEKEQQMYKELCTSLRKIEQAWDEYGPFDGVLGFSQGGVLSTFVLQLSRINREKLKIETHGLELDKNVNFKFALLFNCCESRSMQRLKLNITIEEDAILALGRSDGVIPLEVGKKLTQVYENIKLFEHPGGHWLPFHDDFRDLFDNFIDDQFKKLRA